MKSVNVHEAEEQLTALLAELEDTGSPIVVCRNGSPVADLVPHRTEVSMCRDPQLGGITLLYDPCTPLSSEEWPQLEP